MLKKELKGNELEIIPDVKIDGYVRYFPQKRVKKICDNCLKKKGLDVHIMVKFNDECVFCYMGGFETNDCLYKLEHIMSNQNAE